MVDIKAISCQIHEGSISFVDPVMFCFWIANFAIVAFQFLFSYKFQDVSFDVWVYSWWTAKFRCSSWCKYRCEYVKRSSRFRRSYSISICLALHYPTYISPTSFYFLFTPFLAPRQSRNSRPSQDEGKPLPSPW